MTSITKTFQLPVNPPSEWTPFGTIQPPPYTENVTLTLSVDDSVTADQLQALTAITIGIQNPAPGPIA